MPTTQSLDATALATTPANAPAVDTATTDQREVDRFELASVIAAWPNLPAAIRAGVLAMVRVIGGQP